MENSFLVPILLFQRLGKQIASERGTLPRRKVGMLQKNRWEVGLDHLWIQIPAH